MAVVRLEHITKHYDAAHPPAVDDVNLTIEDGEFMVLLGPSGCGKSTTLRMIAGLESITGGTLSIDGEVMNRVPAKNRDIAMVFQSYALYPHMTVRNNLAFGLLRRRFPRNDVKRRVEEAAEALGLTQFLDRKPHALSGGQRQRVALGRAIVRDPKVFLFDEPLSNLDAALRVRTRGELIKQYRQLGATMIYVTHDQVEAMTMGSRICVMNHGRVVQVGEPLEVYNSPADTFVASFIGSPPTNLVNTSVCAEGEAVTARLAGTELALLGYRERDLQGPEAIFGIRPEDVYLSPPGQEPGRYAAVKASIVAVEPLGAETILMLAVEGAAQEVIARVGREMAGAPGETITVFFDLHAAHLFDPRSTRALSRSGVHLAQPGKLEVRGAG
jgi:multiple sugar transport system ATP-binding protein